MTEMQSVGMREFRAHLAKYTRKGSAPVEITSHGEAVGYYIPARPAPEKSDLEALLHATRHFASLLKERGVTEDELMADFRAMRETKPSA